MGGRREGGGVQEGTWRIVVLSCCLALPDTAYY